MAIRRGYAAPPGSVGPQPEGRVAPKHRGYPTRPDGRDRLPLARPHDQPQSRRPRASAGATPMSISRRGFKLRKESAGRPPQKLEALQRRVQLELAVIEQKIAQDALLGEQEDRFEVRRVGLLLDVVVSHADRP